MDFSAGKKADFAVKNVLSAHCNLWPIFGSWKAKSAVGNWDRTSESRVWAKQIHSVTKVVEFSGADSEVPIVSTVWNLLGEIK